MTAASAYSRFRMILPTAYPFLLSSPLHFCFWYKSVFWEIIFFKIIKKPQKLKYCKIFLFVSDSCSGVVCGTGKKCVIRSGRPKCVCAPDCKEKGRHIKGPVCGTDGRSYRNVCRLKKRACRRSSSFLTVAYHGYCQSNCIILSFMH